MDLPTLIAAIGSSLGASIAGVYWFAKTIIKHGLDRDIEDHKSRLALDLERQKNKLSSELEREKFAWQGELAHDKALLEGSVRREVELFLGERESERQYEFEARRRLYLAIGPLRFQLLLACRDIAGRILSYARAERYAMDIEGYYGRSTLYRLLRPIAILELMERQIAYSDFAVDQSALDCLRLKKTLSRILSGDDVLCGHPAVDWSRQKEHVYADTIPAVAATLICEIPDQPDRVQRFEEFREAIVNDGADRLAPFPQLLADFSANGKPILWLRLVALAHACNAFIERQGEDLGFQHDPFPIRELLAISQDGFIQDHLADYEAAISETTLLQL